MLKLKWFLLYIHLWAFSMVNYHQFEQQTGCITVWMASKCAVISKWKTFECRVSWCLCIMSLLLLVSGSRSIFRIWPLSWLLLSHGKTDCFLYVIQNSYIIGMDPLVSMQFYNWSGCFVAGQVFMLTKSLPVYVSHLKRHSREAAWPP